MKEIKVNKAKLIETLKHNRAEHRGLFLEAQTKYRAVAIYSLDLQLKKARDGSSFELSSLTSLQAPEDHTNEYDRSLQMLEMSVDDEIVITTQEFANYVQDIWSWSRNWGASNLRYVDNKKTRAMSLL